MARVSAAAVPGHRCGGGVTFFSDATAVPAPGKSGHRRRYGHLGDPLPAAVSWRYHDRVSGPGGRIDALGRISLGAADRQPAARRSRPMTAMASVGESRLAPVLLGRIVVSPAIICPLSADGPGR